jgi:hypothetical protein
VANAEVLGTVGDLTYVKKSAPLANAGGGGTTTRRVEALCPAGTEAVGGGTAVSGNPLRSYVSTSGPAGRAWKSAGWHRDSPAADVTSWGICTSQLERFRVKSQPLSVTGGANVSSAVPCGASGSAVSGGVIPTGDVAEWWLNATHPLDVGSDGDPDETWQTSVFHRPGFPLTALTFKAVCREGPLPTYDAQGVAFSTQRRVSPTAECPNHKSVVGGGPDVSGAASEVHVSRTGPIDLGDNDRIPDDGWSATFANPAGGEHDFVAYAVCI